MPEVTFRQAWADRKRVRHLRLPADVRAELQLADRVIAELDAQVAQLQGQVDGYHGRTVLHCMERDMDDAAMTSLDEPEGTILRATDSGRELILSGRTWQPR